MPVRSILELVQARMPALTASERKLARALVGAYPIAGLEPIPKFVARAGVSPPTALRFVAKLGFNGYPDFQSALREEVQLRISSPASRYDGAATTPDGGFVSVSFEALVQAMVGTASAVAPYDFDMTLQLLADRRKRISALGGRTSHMLASHLAHRLGQLRPSVRLLPAQSTTLMEHVADMGRRDVVVIFDYKRYQGDTIRFAQQAAGTGATVIVITDPLLSPAASAARHVLTFHLAAISPFDSMTAAFALVDVVVAGVAARLGDVGRGRIERLESLNHAWMWDAKLLQRDEDDRAQ